MIRLSISADVVTPHAGVWIETCLRDSRSPPIQVTPHAGVWIETIGNFEKAVEVNVTPHAGVWIETGFM